MTTKLGITAGRQLRIPNRSGVAASSLPAQSADHKTPPCGGAGDGAVRQLMVSSEAGASEQVTKGRSTQYTRKSVDWTHKRNEIDDCVGSLRTATFDEFQLVVSQFHDLGLGVEFSHGLK